MSRDHPNANVTDNETRTEQALRSSELSYRRLFEAAKDGILILDADKGRITERKRAGEKLHLRESFLSAITENQPGLLWLKDAEGRFLMVNKAFATACGRGEPEKVHGLTDLDIWPKELAEKYCNDDQRVMATGNACMVEERIIIGNSQVWHETFKTPVRDDKGRVIGTTGYARDITDRKRVEEALRESQAFYHSLVEQLPAGVFRKDQAGRYVFVSSEFCRLKNMKAEEFLGKTPQEVAAGEAAHRDAVGQAVKYAGAGEDHHRLIMQTGKPIELVEEYATADGRKQFVQSLKIPVLDLAGQIIGTQGILLDITELKQAEMALLDSEQRYRQLFDLASDAVILVDSETHRYMDVNQATQRLYGYSREEFLQMTPEDVSAEPDKTHDHIAAGDAHVPFRWHRKKNGERFAVEITANQIIHRGRRTALVTLRDVTARLQAEMAVRESQALYHSLVDQMPAGIFRKDRAGRYVFVNSWFCQFHSLTGDQFIGRTPEELALAEEARGPKYLEILQSFRDGSKHHEEILRTGKPVCVEEVYSTAEGGKRHLYVEKSAVFGPDGQIAGTQGIQFDITERKRAEDELKTILRTTMDGFYLVEKDGRFLDCNDAYCRMIGYRREEMLTMAIKDIEAIDSDEDIKNRIQQIMDKGYAFFETKHRRKDGRVIDIEASVTALKEGGGKLVVFMHDITERKRAEEEIKRTAQEWQNTFDATKDAIWILDLNNRILRTNKTAEKFFKRPCSEMTGKPCWEIAHGTTEPIPNCPYVRSRKSGQRETMELQQNGRWFEDTVDPIFDAAGQYAGAVHIVSDITEHRKLEAQFRQSQKMEAIGTLAGGVAHDFNNILGVIMGYGDFILAGLEPDSPLRKYAEEVRHAADRAAGLTKQLLIFSRKQTVQPVVLDLNDTVKDLEKMLRRLIGENIEMVVVPGKAIGRIKADAGYIGQVLMNLVVNARDAMPIGGKLTLETANVSFDQDSAGRHPELKPGDYVMLTVNDTGTGMTPEVKARLFEALFTTKPAGKGTGLGLVTCQTIVQQSGGHIEVDSEVGKGTTFKIYFPRVDKPLDVAVGSNLTGPMPRGTETLLLVEDEASVRHLTWHLLESLGYRVLRANNGQDALQLVHEHQGPSVRLVVTDVVMPRMGGKVMADWLKTTYPGIKILFTSGYTDDALAKQGVLEPGVAFLSKPYTPATLARKVRTMLDNETDTSILRKLKTTGNQSPLDTP